MFTLHRKSKPESQPVDMAAVIAGIRRYADDLEAGDELAVAAMDAGEYPISAEYWAAYPDGQWTP